MELDKYRRMAELEQRRYERARRGKDNNPSVQYVQREMWKNGKVYDPIFSNLKGGY